MKTLILLACFFGFSAFADQNFKWPNQTKAAVSLSYDDALNSQLDNAIPALNHHQFKGTFYLSLAATTLQTRLADWRSAAKQGHELGNHTINHACRGSLPNREWVPKHNDLDKKLFKEILQEIHTANAFLHAIDGEIVRTFTVPCTDTIVENKHYPSALTDLFIGMKTQVGSVPESMHVFDRLNAPVWAPHNVSGAALIDYVKTAQKHGTVANITFHGIGGDHLAVTKQAHQALLTYLSENKETYWVDTYRNISKYIAEYPNKTP